MKKGVPVGRALGIKHTVFRFSRVPRNFQRFELLVSVLKALRAPVGQSRRCRGVKASVLARQGVEIDSKGSHPVREGVTKETTRDGQHMMDKGT